MMGDNKEIRNMRGYDRWESRRPSADDMMAQDLIEFSKGHLDIP
jgi:hypothetical protein